MADPEGVRVRGGALARGVRPSALSGRRPPPPHRHPTVHTARAQDVMRGAGEVTRVDVLTDASGRSKGCALVEFADAGSALRAIDNLQDVEIDGRPIWVREDREGDPGCRVFVGNLSYQTTWKALKDVMRDAGEVTHVDVLGEGTGRSKGCAIVQYADAAGAAAAINTLQDVEIDGRQIFVREDREG